MFVNIGFHCLQRCWFLVFPPTAPTFTGVAICDHSSALQVCSHAASCRFSGFVSAVSGFSDPLAPRSATDTVSHFIVMVLQKRIHEPFPVLPFLIFLLFGRRMLKVYWRNRRSCFWVFILFVHQRWVSYKTSTLPTNHYIQKRFG